MRLGILQRYVMGDVLRSFLMALLTITIVFVLFIVMTEATRNGLTPREILALIPFLIPGSLPYTVPVSMLFAVTVVYGRLAGDNEVIAVKTAGLSAWTVLWPSMSLGLVVSAGLMLAAGTAIPMANGQVTKVVFKSFEDLFYRYLKKDREFNRGEWPFLIKVSDVQDRVLINATFKHRADTKRPRKPGEPDDPAQFDTIIKAKRATIKFDIEHELAHVYLDGADIQQGDQNNVLIINDSQFDFPLSPDVKKPMPKRIQEMTDSDLIREKREVDRKLAFERERQAKAAALWIGSGRVARTDWVGFERAFIDYAFWRQKSNEYETERQMRGAMAWGSFFFVFLGAPVGIRFARRDFLSAFITCFVPIILIYYPLMLGGVNLGKEGFVNAMVALWIGNVVLFVGAAAMLRPVLRH